MKTAAFLIGLLVGISFGDIGTVHAQGGLTVKLPTAPSTAMVGPKAADFTFNVPVVLKSILPSVKEGKVTCYVYDGAGDAMGNGATRFSLPGDPGKFSEVVVVRVNAASGKLAIGATEYACALELQVGGKWYSPDDPGKNPPLDIIPKPGDHKITFIKGKIPGAIQ